MDGDAEKIANPDALPLMLEVNGERRQDSNTNMLIYDCQRLIEFAWSFYTLYPGDLIYTGTPEGVGPIKPGDILASRSSPALGELRIACTCARHERYTREPHPSLRPEPKRLSMARFHLGDAVGML